MRLPCLSLPHRIGSHKSATPSHNNPVLSSDCTPLPACYIGLCTSSESAHHPPMILLSELLMLVAWFCGPATLLALGWETWLFRKNGLLKDRRWTVATCYFATVILMPIISIAFLAAGVGQSPLASQNHKFLVPWFWQSFVAAAIVGGLVAIWAKKQAGK